MTKLLHRLARAVSHPSGAKIVLVSWLLLAAGLSVLAPGAKPYSASSGEGSIHNDTPSSVAQALLNKHFPSEDGLTALLVFHGSSTITPSERAQIAAVSKWLSSDQRPDGLASALPFHLLPEAVQDQLFSEDGTTLLINVAMRKDAESDMIYETLQQIRDYVEQVSGISSLQFEITGPAGIASDTIALFKQADFVLMLATIGLILVLLILIYRSPLLAVIPLAVAGIVYQVVDRLLGIAGKYQWFVVDKQALSIMMILLFAVLTDYCLFVLSRYREQLRRIGSKYDAMKVALLQVMEPILFSGGTVLAAVLVLFAAVFKPYYSFAPVFAVTVIVMLIGGITLIPAVFALAGRKAFWPFIPKLEENGRKHAGLWGRIGDFVTRRPALVAGSLLLFLILASINIGSIRYSFNLMKSFPDDISSRIGFDILDERYPKGQLAPVTVVLASDRKIEWDEPFVQQLTSLTDKLREQKGISSVSPEVMPDTAEDAALTRNFLSEQKQSIRLQLTLEDNPYDQSALDLLHELRNNSKRLLRESGFDPLQYQLHYSGQTAEQLDVRRMNQTDIVVIFSLIAIVLAIMLAFQSGSIKIAMVMMSTLLLSYTAALGFSWFLYHEILGYDSISYRLPVYTFVFLMALGVDYNIMLVSRIKEEARNYEWKQAVKRAVALTGGVISSAGVILGATFCVLITQPVQELFLFGMTMAIGILADTFLIRGMLFPSLMMYFGKETQSVPSPAFFKGN